ncbi:hypothetical protein J6590_097249 [Homalodisca vitripennis]|nr:hypothetical protein J6590_097249 [Homalodisca vitripennis]
MPACMAQPKNTSKRATSDSATPHGICKSWNVCGAPMIRNNTRESDTDLKPVCQRSAVQRLLELELVTGQEPVLEDCRFLPVPRDLQPYFDPDAATPSF